MQCNNSSVLQKTAYFISQNSAFNHFQEEQGVVGWWVGGCLIGRGHKIGQKIAEADTLPP